MKHYSYKSFGDWVKGVCAFCLLNIGDKLNSSSMICKAMDIGERMLYTYIGAEKRNTRGRVTFGFRGIDYEQL